MAFVRARRQTFVLTCRAEALPIAKMIVAAGAREAGQASRLSCFFVGGKFPFVWR